MFRAVIGLSLVLLAGCASPPGTPEPDLDNPAGAIYLTGEGGDIDRATLADRLAAADVIILGEVHDNPLHHRVQAWLTGRVAPSGVAFEMFAESDETAINALLAGGGAPGDIAELVGWEKTGWPDFAQYEPIIAAAPGAVITAGALDRKVLRRAYAEGAAAVNAHEEMGEALAKPIAPEIRAVLEQEMIDAHCGKIDAKVAAGLVESQRLRDASFAAAVLRARSGAGKAVLITGNGHARTDRGVPAYLRSAAPELVVLSLGQIEAAEAEPAEIAALPYDFVWVSPPIERPDPCAAFD